MLLTAALPFGICYRLTYWAVQVCKSEFMAYVAGANATLLLGNSRSTLVFVSFVKAVHQQCNATIKTETKPCKPG